jgi:pilus assembly protein CpaE
MQNEDLMIRIEAKNPDVAGQLERLVRSLQGMRIHPSGDMNGNGLLIFELGRELERDFLYVEALLSSKAVGEVFLTSRDPSPELLMHAIRTGAKEFLSQPLVEEEVRQALLRYKRRRNGSNHRELLKAGKITSVIGGKGGVGATTVAVNLAVSMMQREDISSVALIDMNLLFGEIPVFLEMRPKYHWGEIASQIDRLDSDFLMNILSRHSSGIYVLPSPAYFHYDQEKMPKIIERVLGLARSMFDVVIIDGGHSLGGLSSKTLEMSDEVLLISTMSLPCLSNTNKLLESFRSLGYPPRERIKIVMNRYEKNSEISLKEAKESVHQRIFCTLPNNYKATMTAINQGKPLDEIAPHSPITKGVKRLARMLVEGEDAVEKKRGWSFRLRGFSKAGSRPLSTLERRVG